MMKVTQVFIDAPVVLDDDALTGDVIMHLSDHAPHVITAYLPATLWRWCAIRQFLRATTLG